ncbi:MAG: carboxypeptidase regulatory-like domain-containing protein [Selenomonadaceae bacterium]|nr:carboxypeptidase regulatory-like domain-containing protein [Selenomonadaceae bacterium]
MKKFLSILVCGMILASFNQVEASRFKDVMGYDVEFEHRAPIPDHSTHIVGKITDSNGELIDDAQIEFAFIDGRTFFAEADYRGRYEIYVPSNLSCDIFVNSGGYRSIHQERHGFSRDYYPTELNFTLYHDWISGKILDEFDYPIENARITIEQNGGENSIRENFTDFRGNYRIYLPEDGASYFVEIYCPGYRIYRTQMRFRDEDVQNFRLSRE